MPTDQAGAGASASASRSFARTPARIPPGFWAFTSAAVHALIVVVSLQPQRPHHAAAAAESRVWMESTPPREPPPTLPPPPPPAPPPRARRASPQLDPQAPPPAAPAPAEPLQAESPAPPGAIAEVAHGDGTLAVGTGVTGGVVGGTGQGRGQDAGTSPDVAREPERKLGPPQLSLWMNPEALEHMALARPSIALLMAVPGYRDALRGSGIRPFADLQRLYIRLGGLGAQRLAVAGVHIGGERALMEVAERIAAMRNQKPVWRGDSDLRATSWVDGSGFDRGLAVHGGAFVIAERTAMAALLGGGGKVAGLSQMRERVVAALSIEDAARYLPALAPCALQALRVSIGDGGGRYRMTLHGHYRSAPLAAEAPACLRALPASAAPLAGLVRWLAHASSAPGSFSTSLTKEVTNDDVEQLLEQLAWALRSA